MARARARPAARSPARLILVQSRACGRIFRLELRVRYRRRPGLKKIVHRQGLGAGRRARQHGPIWSAILLGRNKSRATKLSNGKAREHRDAVIALLSFEGRMFRSPIRLKSLDRKPDRPTTGLLSAQTSGGGPPLMNWRTRSIRAARLDVPGEMVRRMGWVTLCRRPTHDFARARATVSVVRV